MENKYQLTFKKSSSVNKFKIKLNLSLLKNKYKDDKN